MFPKITLLGRPNVGKSTLFNRLIRSNRAITHDRPGITRDRMEGFVQSKDHQSFTLIDTGGVLLDAHHAPIPGGMHMYGFEKNIFQQIQIAIKESHALCLVVDAREGILPFDEHLALYIRRSNKPLLLIVNKVDSIEKEEQIIANFYTLGLPIVAVSAEHGHNIRLLREELASIIPKEDTSTPADNPHTSSIKLAILGRPNAGKSSMVNAIINDHRMIVSDVAGTTRDSVDTFFMYNNTPYMFVDTAGIRRRTKITDIVEKFSVSSALKSATKSHVTLYVIDATENITTQDKRLIDLLDTKKIPFMILINKIDLISRADRTNLTKELKKTIQFCAHIPVLMTSTVTKLGLENIIPIAEQIYAECSTRITTSILNTSMKEVITKHQHPVVRRVRPKFFYLTQAESNPPTFVFFVNDAERISESYTRYLERSVRKLFSISYAPIRICLRSSHKKQRQKLSTTKA